MVPSRIWADLWSDAVEINWTYCLLAVVFWNSGLAVAAGAADAAGAAVGATAATGAGVAPEPATGSKGSRPLEGGGGGSVGCVMFGMTSLLGEVTEVEFVGGLALPPGWLISKFTMKNATAATPT